MEFLPSYTNFLQADIQPSYTDDLMHFGIKGMHWGVRRYQNPDGSLTDAGRKRYASQGLILSGGHKDFTTSNQKALGLRDESEFTQREAIRLSNKSNAFAKEYSDNYEKAVSVLRNTHLENNKQAMAEARQLMKKALVSVDMVDDDEYIDIVAANVSWSLNPKYCKQTPEGKQIDSYVKNVQKVMKDAEKTTDKIIRKTGDQTVEAFYQNRKQTTKYRDIVNATLKNNLNGLSVYLAKHPDSIWDEAMDDNRMLTTDSFAEAIAADFRKNK